MIKMLAALGVREIEIGYLRSCPESIEEDLLRLQSAFGLSFLFHNYFPPPRNPFVLNLASTDPLILARSRSLCVQAIDLSVSLGAAFYSVHAGFCFVADPSDLGGRQIDLARINPAVAEEVFVESLVILKEHAAGRLPILVENNVVDERNLIDGRNLLALGVDSDDLLRLLEKAGQAGLGLLVDLGHLKVSAASLGFDREEFLRAVAPHTGALHLSDNDGRFDSNDPVKHESWFWDPVERLLPATTVCILEAHSLAADEIVDQLTMISSKMACQPLGGVL
jgi:sugar phosphate isomerase/epimerase